MNWQQALKRLQVATGMRQKAIASKVGVSEATVSRWMKGQAEPEYEYQEILISLFEEHSEVLERNIVAEVEASDRLLLATNRNGRLIAASRSFRQLLIENGISDWTTLPSECGMWRMTELKVDLRKSKPENSE